MWEAIQQLCPLAQPTHMLMDFEKATINSFLHYWPHTIVKVVSFTYPKIYLERYRAKDFKMSINRIQTLNTLPGCSSESSHASD